MAQINDYNNIYKSEEITQIQIDYYVGPEMTFINTVLIQSFKLITPTLIRRFNCHPHPLNSLRDTPFSIINGKKLLDKEATFKMLPIFIQLSNAPIDQQQNSVRQLQTGIMLQSLFDYCQQLSQIATVVNQDDINPYYIFLNPLLKFKQYRKSQALKRKVQSNTQYLDRHEKLNIDQLIYKLNLLEELVRQIQKKPLILCYRKFVGICMIALMKHFYVNSQVIYKAALSQPLFTSVEENKITFMMELTEFQQKLVQENRKITSMFVDFRLPPYQKDEEPEEYEVLKQRFYKALVKPLSVTCLVIVLMKIF